MKLYIYEHCPFSARTRYVAKILGVDLQEIVVSYDDQHTLIDLAGIKTVPILVKDDGTVMSESSHIMAYLMNLKPVTNPKKQIKKP